MSTRTVLTIDAVLEVDPERGSLVILRTLTPLFQTRDFPERAFPDRPLDFQRSGSREAYDHNWLPRGPLLYLCGRPRQGVGAGGARIGRA